MSTKTLKVRRFVSGLAHLMFTTPSPLVRRMSYDEIMADTYGLESEREERKVTKEVENKGIFLWWIQFWRSTWLSRLTNSTTVGASSSRPISKSVSSSGSPTLEVCLSKAYRDPGSRVRLDWYICIVEVNNWGCAIRLQEHALCAIRLVTLGEIVYTPREVLDKALYGLQPLHCNIPIKNHVIVVLCLFKSRKFSYSKPYFSLENYMVGTFR